MRLNRMNAPAACCHFFIFIGSFLYQRAKPPQGIVLFINLLRKGLTPRVCVGDGCSIWWAPAFNAFISPLTSSFEIKAEPMLSSLIRVKSFKSHPEPCYTLLSYFCCMLAKIAHPTQLTQEVYQKKQTITLPSHTCKHTELAVKSSRHAKNKARLYVKLPLFFLVRKFDQQK